MENKPLTVTIVLTMATVTLQVTTAGHSQCHGDSPLKLRNDVIV